MKKFIFAAFITGIVIMTFTSSLLAEEIFRIGTTLIPPYTTEDEDGAIGGFATEIVEHVLRNMNVNYTIDMYPFIRALKMLEDGELHGMYIAGKNPARAEQFYFPKEPLVTTNWVWFIRKEDEGTLQYFSFDDLNGKRIGTIRGYYLPNDLKEYILKHCVVEEVTREEQNFLKLVAKRVDLIMSEESIGTYFAHKLGIEENVIALLQPQKSIIGYVSTHHLMFSKKVVTQEFVDEFSRMLREFKSTEEYDTMRTRYQYKGDDTGAVLRDMEY